MSETVNFQPDLLDTHCKVDALTPLDFAENHLPGAINVPLLSNEERLKIKLLATCYICIYNSLSFAKQRRSQAQSV